MFAGADALMAEIEFGAYLEDCLVGARIDLPEGLRLTDYLNESDDIAMTEAALTALDDGRVVTGGDVVVPITDIHLVEASDESGGHDRRIRTRSSEVDMVVGPYRVHGYVHGPTAGDPVAGLSRRQAMIPVTSATIAFLLAGQPQIREREVVIVNRLLAYIGTPKKSSQSVLDKFGLSPVDPNAKDLTGELRAETIPKDRRKG